MAGLEATVLALLGLATPVVESERFGPVCENHPDDPLYTFALRHVQYPMPDPEIVSSELAAIAYRADSLSEGVCEVRRVSITDYEATLGQVGMERLPSAQEVVRLSSSPGHVYLVGIPGANVPVGTAVEGPIGAIGVGTPVPADWIEYLANNDDISGAFLQLDHAGNNVEVGSIVIELDQWAADEIDLYAANHVGEPLYVVLDGIVVLRPVISGPLGTSIRISAGVDDPIYVDLEFALNMPTRRVGGFEIEDVTEDRR